MGTWLENEGCTVIPNIRFGDERTYRLTCSGVNTKTTIAIGSVGCVKDCDDKQFLVEGSISVLEILKPTVLVIYGTIPVEIEDYCCNEGIKVVAFESETAKCFKMKGGE